MVDEATGSLEIAEGDHALNVLLASRPGSSLTIEIRAALAEDLAAIVDFFIAALQDQDEAEAVVRETLAAAIETPLEDVQEILGDIASQRAGNFSSLTTGTERTWSSPNSLRAHISTPACSRDRRAEDIHACPWSMKLCWLDSHACSGAALPMLIATLQACEV